MSNIKIFHDNKILIICFKLSKRQSLLPTTVLLRTTLIRTIKLHFYIYSNVILNPKGSNNLLYFKLRSSIPSCWWRIIWFQTSGRYKYTEQLWRGGEPGGVSDPFNPLPGFATEVHFHNLTNYRFCDQILSTWNNLHCQSSWTDEKEINLITIWLEKPCLFDVTSSEYSNRLKKDCVSINPCLRP